MLATDRVLQPVSLAVQGPHVYWADQAHPNGYLARVDKVTGHNYLVITGNYVVTGHSYLVTLVTVIWSQ